MANQLQTTVWYIDTVMANPFPLEAGAKVHVEDWSWNNAPVGARLTILDRKGNILVDQLADNKAFGSTKLGWVDGIQVTVLGGGNVTINVNK